MRRLAIAGAILGAAWSGLAVGAIAAWCRCCPEPPELGRS